MIMICNIVDATCYPASAAAVFVLGSSPVNGDGGSCTPFNSVNAGIEYCATYGPAPDPSDLTVTCAVTIIPLAAATLSDSLIPIVGKSITVTTDPASPTAIVVVSGSLNLNLYAVVSFVKITLQEGTMTTYFADVPSTATLTLSECIANSFTQQLIRSTGSTYLMDSTFEENKDSILSVESFGTTILVNNCVFTNNEVSGRGIIHIEPLGSTQPDQKMSVTVNLCTFTGSKGTSGAVILLSVDTSIFNGEYTNLTNEVNVAYSTFTLSEITSFSVSGSFVQRTVLACQFTANLETVIQISQLGYTTIIAQSTFSDHNVLGKNVLEINLLYDSVALVDSTIQNGTMRPIYVNNPIDTYSTSVIMVQSSTFLNNYPGNDQDGGAISVTRGVLMIILSNTTSPAIQTVFDGHQGSKGGTIFLSLGAMLISDTVIMNSKGERGGAIYGTIFQGHLERSHLKTIETTNKGGILFEFGLTFTIRSCTFEDVRGDEQAPGIYILSMKPFMYDLFFKDININKNVIEDSLSDYTYKEDWASLRFSNVTAEVFISLAVVNVGLDGFRIDSDCQADYAFRSFDSELDLQNIDVSCPIEKSVFHIIYSKAQVPIKNVDIHDAEINVIIHNMNNDIYIENFNVWNVTGSLIMNFYQVENGIIDGFVFENVTSSLLSIEESVFTFENGQVKNITDNQASSSLTSLSSTFTFNQVDFLDINLNIYSNLASLSSDSNVYFQKSTITDMYALGGNIINLEDSNLTFTECTIQDFNSTFIEASTANVHWVDSLVQNAGYPSYDFKRAVSLQGIATNGIDTNIFVQGSTFKNLLSMRGGAIYSEQISDDLTTYLETTNSKFEDCVALQDHGGAIYTDLQHNTIKSTEFSRNVAVDSGGGIYFACTITPCSNNVTSSNFVQNQALNGGAWRWHKEAEPTWSGVEFNQNWAEYAPNIAAIPKEYILINATTYEEIPVIKRELSDQALPTISSDVVTGQEIDFTILLKMVDKYHEIISTNSKTLSIIESESGDVKISGKTSALSVKGYTNWQKLIFVGEVERMHRFLITSVETDGNSTLATYTIDLWFRDCVPGEIFQTEECKICAAGTYSVDTTESSCNECLDEIDCLGGADIRLNTGYWRVSELSDDIYKCPIMDNCKGEATGVCNNGYEGRLCTECIQGWYKRDTYICDECETDALIVFQLIALLIGVICILAISLYSLWLQNSTQLLSSYIRIMLNYLQTMAFVNFYNMSWPKLLLDMLHIYGRTASFLQFTVALECLYTMDTKHVFIKLMFILIAPAVTCLIIIALWIMVAFCKKNRTYIRVHLPTTLLFVAFIVYSYLINPLLLYISCHKMEEGRWWLVADYSVECWTGDHLLYLYTIWVPAMLLWTFGLLTLFIVVIVKMNGRLHELDIQIIMNYLMRGYQDRYYFWEMVILSRKVSLILVGALLATNSSLLRGASGFSVMGIALFLQYRYAPLINDDLNFTEYIAMIANTVTLYCGMFFATDARDNSVFNILLLTTVLLVNFYFLFYWCRNVYRYYLVAKFGQKKWFMRIHSVISRIKCACITRKSADKYAVAPADDSISKDGDHPSPDDSNEIVSPYSYSKSLSLNSSGRVLNVSSDRIS